jgi:hypothetical protein
MKVKDVIGEKEKQVSSQTGRGYYDYIKCEKVMGFRHDGQIYILSARLSVDYEHTKVYDTATDKLYMRKTLCVDNNGGLSVKENHWRTKSVTDIDVIRKIVADKLGKGDIEIVGIDVKSSNKLSQNHATWKRVGAMPTIQHQVRTDFDGNEYRINSTGTWPMPKHLLDRCIITETSNTNEEVDGISEYTKLGNVINVEMI